MAGFSKSIMCRRTWSTPDNRLSRLMKHHMLHDRAKSKTSGLCKGLIPNSYGSEIVRECLRVVTPTDLVFFRKKAKGARIVLYDQSATLVDDVDAHADIRNSVRALCGAFPGEYWRELDRNSEYPQAFVKALSDAGFLSALIPEQFGGSGLPLSAAAAILEEFTAMAATARRVMRRCTSWERCCGTEATRKSSFTYRKSPRANFVCRLSA